ncbi:MAG: AI-2E family transporter [Halioglobus sp.]
MQGHDGDPDASLPSIVTRRFETALWVLVGLVLLYAVQQAASLLVPVVAAMLIALLLNPLVVWLGRLRLPRAVAAPILMIALGVPFAVLGAQLAEPAQRWIERAPELTARVNEQLENLSEALDPGMSATTVIATPPEPSGFGRFLDWFSGSEPDANSPAVKESANSPLVNRLVSGGIDLAMRVLSDAPVLVAQFLSTIILVLFSLIYGPALYATLVATQSNPESSEKLTRIALDTQQQLSRYILTVSVINALLGATTAAALWLLDFPDPLLWGMMVAFLNYAPYVGPIIGVTIIAVAGIAEYGLALASLVPAMTYFAINAMEAQLVTPQALGLHMRMNPLLIMLWLMLWGWLWGIAGVLVAVPLLVCLKLVLSQFPRYQAGLKLIEARIR